MSKNLTIYSNRWQGCFLVLYTVDDLGGAPTSRETIDRIEAGHWYELRFDDLPPYEGLAEAGYKTLLRWARKDLVEFGYIANDQRDEWRITPEGRERLRERVADFQAGKISVSRCYLWTPGFKRDVDPTYRPSTADAPRPRPVPRRSEKRKQLRALTEELRRIM